MSQGQNFPWLYRAGNSTARIRTLPFAVWKIPRVWSEQLFHLDQGELFFQRKILFVKELGAIQKWRQHSILGDSSSSFVNHSTTMVPYFRLQAPPTDIRASAFFPPGWRHFWMAPNFLYVTHFHFTNHAVANHGSFRPDFFSTPISKESWAMSRGPGAFIIWPLINPVWTCRKCCGNHS